MNNRRRFFASLVALAGAGTAKKLNATTSIPNFFDANTPLGSSTNPYLGQINIFPYNFAPQGWAFCDGQLLSIAANSALFSLIGTTYGGNGSTTFGLPDLRGRAPIHEGTGPGLTTRTLGQQLGEETITLNVSNLPAHSHTLNAINISQNQGQKSVPTSGSILASSKDQRFIESTESSSHVSLQSNTTGNTGLGQSINNIQPSLVLNYCIATTGLYPSPS